MTTFKKVYQKGERFQPAWFEKFERFNQMDPASFYLGEFLWEHKDLLRRKLPEAIVLNSSDSSHVSDRSYVEDTKLRNPAKFIYTLPSVKINVICGLLDWEGPTYCFIGDSAERSSVLQSVFEKSLWIIDFEETETEIEVSLKLEVVDQDVGLVKEDH